METETKIVDTLKRRKPSKGRLLVRAEMLRLLSLLALLIFALGLVWYAHTNYVRNFETEIDAR